MPAAVNFRTCLLLRNYCTKKEKLKTLKLITIRKEYQKPIKYQARRFTTIS